MQSRALSPLLLRSPRPALALGVLAAAGGTLLATLAIYPLEHLAPTDSLGVVYLPTVIVVATYWGSGLGLLTALASGLAYNYFHLPIVGHLTFSDGIDWVSLVAFLVVAATAGVVGNLARARAAEAESRRREADLATEMARLLLGGARLDAALAAAAQRLAAALNVASAAIELGDVEADERRLAFPLRDRDLIIGTLLLPVTLSAARPRAHHRRGSCPRCNRCSPPRCTAPSCRREVVETALLRRSDEMKTAVLRSVSHDLRTPITAIISAATALPDDTPEAAEARAVVLEAAPRLSRLIEKLLDLSLLQAGTRERRSVPYTIEDVLHEAVAHVRTDSPEQPFRVSLDEDLPRSPATRHSSSERSRTCSRMRRATPAASRSRSGRIVPASGCACGSSTRGPASARARSTGSSFRSTARRTTLRATTARGSGWRSRAASSRLDGGRITVESLPGQGTSFVVDLPLAALTERCSSPRSSSSRCHAADGRRANPRLRRRPADPARAAAGLARRGL